MTRPAAAILLAALGGCAAFAPPDGAGGPVVAEHLNYVNDYMAADESERERLSRELDTAANPDNPGNRLRRAIVLSLDDDDPERLARSLELLGELRDAEGLNPAERWLARLWHGEVASRLDLTRENADIRVALEQAERKLDQLTLIEEQLEAQDNDSEAQENDSEEQ